jgi:catechol 2,3-dioxygenase-like lactoylglutathione lyase family enzyme
VRVIRLAWLGIPTSNYPAMVSFLRDTMGLRVEFDEPATTELSLPNDDRLQVFAPGHPYFAFFQDHAQGLVPLFEVEDAQQAAAELRAAGADVIGNPDSDGTWTWIHVRAPDGNLYEFASRRRGEPD